MADSSALVGLAASLAVGSFGLIGLWICRINGTECSPLFVTCASLGIPTAILYIIYLMMVENSSGTTDTQKKATTEAHPANETGLEFKHSNERHLRMMLSDPLLRNPIIHLKPRGLHFCSNKMWCECLCNEGQNEPTSKILMRNTEPHFTQDHLEDVTSIRNNSILEENNTLVKSSKTKSMLSVEI